MTTDPADSESAQADFAAGGHPGAVSTAGPLAHRDAIPPTASPPDADLFDRLCSFENLLRAYRAAARGKRSRPDVAAFDYQLEGYLLRLRATLAAQTYRPGPYRRYTVREVIQG